MKTATRILILVLVFGTAATAYARGPRRVRVRRAPAASPRVAHPVQVSYSQKHLVFSGGELGFRFLSGHLEAHVGVGANLLAEKAITTCNAYRCESASRLMLEGGLRWYPLYGQFSPYVSLGIMGSPDQEAPVGLAGAGIHWNSRFGLTLNAGMEVAIGAEEDAPTFLPTFTVGYAF